MTSLSDSGVGSLREAIGLASESAVNDTIQFDLSSLGAGPHTIQLQSTLDIPRSMIIDGPGADQLTIDGGWVPGVGGGVRIFQLSETDGEEFVSISGLTLAHGNSIPSEIVGGGAIKSDSVELSLSDMVFAANNADQGGAVYLVNLENIDNFESVNLYIDNSQFTNNSAFEGGAIFNEKGHVELRNGSIVRNNTATVNGGGIFTRGVGEIIIPSTLYVDNSVIENNTATGDGGGIYNFEDHVEVFNNSRVSGNIAGGDGGGVWTRGNINFGGEGANTTLFVFDSLMNDNTAGDQGGAVYAVDDNVTFRNSSVDDNAAKQGGGIYATQVDRYTQLSIEQTTFTNNRVISSGAGGIARGGAIAAENDSQIYLYQSTFTGNSAQGVAESSGGAVYSTYYLYVSAGAFTNNSAIGGDSAGGAIWSSSPFSFGSYVVYASLSGNSADKGGAVYFETESQISSSTLSNNSAGDGGAVWTNSRLEAYNSTISGNSASRNGGGLYISVSEDPSVLTHVTITNNRADSDGNTPGTGGGLFTDGSQELNNTIVAGNFIGGGTTPNDVSGTIRSFSTGNLIGVDTGLNGITNGVNLNQVGTSGAPIVPGLAPLANNGGLTLTHALLDTSPALSSGNNSVAASTDQRDDGFGFGTGFRTQRFTPVDIGAFERSTDFGDAPASYPVLLVNDGARHEMINNLRLGRSVDSNADGLPTADASGDDSIFFFDDDEDGVVFRFVTATFMARADVTASAPGLLTGWIDFNRDGDWDDSGEQIVTDKPLVAGVNPVDFMVGNVDFQGANSVLTFARFRLSTQAGLTPRGPAPDGEVEDYRIRIEKVVLPTSTSGGGFNFTEEPVVRRTPRGFDPLLATGYDYAVRSGPNFATLELPPGYGDNIFTVSFTGFVEGVEANVALTLNAGQELDFENGTIDGISEFEPLFAGATAFRIEGIELSASVDATNPEAFLTIISFTYDGEIDFSQTPIAVFVAVNDSGATGENTLLSSAAPGVLANDTYTGATLTVTEVNGVGGNVGVLTTLASGATVVMNADGSYTYDPGTAFDFLRADQTVTDTFRYKTSDGSRTALATVTITITGVNDVATITGTSTGAVTEDSSTGGSALGTLTVVDVDSGEAAFQSGLPSSSIPGTYGSFTFALATGAWTYVLDNNLPATNALSGGQIVHDTLTVTSLDGTATQLIDVTITGANDAATITGNAAGEVTEDATTMTATGDLDVVDVDSPLTFQTPSGLTGTYGSFTFNTTTGVWLYTLDNADPDTNALVTGQVVQDTLTVKSSDGTATRVIDVTINGNTDVSANTPPTAALTAPSAGVRGQELSFMVSANDSAADSAAGFVYRIQWGDGSPETIIPRTANNGNGITVKHTFAASGTFNVRVVAIDQQNAASTAVSRSVAITAIGVQVDPCNANGTALVVGGSTGSDEIEINRQGSQLRVKLNGTTSYYSNVFTNIIVYGQAGDDEIEVGSSVTTSAMLFGGAGDDEIEAGNGRTVLVGGAGDDELEGGNARDILIGGTGEDEIRGKGDGDILIGGTTVHDNNVVALCQIMDEWDSNRSYQLRISNLHSRLNTSTVFDDNEEDRLSGSGGVDWYFVQLQGRNRDRFSARSNEVVVDLL